MRDAWLHGGGGHSLRDALRRWCPLLSSLSQGRQARAAFARASAGGVGRGDHLALLACYNQWLDSGYSTQWCYQNFVQVRSLRRARDVREQLDALLDQVDVQRSSVLDGGDGDLTPIVKALIAGFFPHACRLTTAPSRAARPSTCTVVGALPVRAAAAVRLDHELVLASMEFMRSVSEIEPGWLREVAPHYYSEEDVDVVAASAKMPRTVGRRA